MGSILLSVGQLDLHNEVLHTLKYVVNQSDNTAQMLRNVSDFLSIAKSVDVPQFNLPQSTMQEIDDLRSRLSSGAEILTDKTNENSVKLRRVFTTMYEVIFLLIVHVTDFHVLRTLFDLYVLIHCSFPQKISVNHSSFCNACSGCFRSWYVLLIRLVPLAIIVRPSQFVT